MKRKSFLSSVKTLHSPNFQKPEEELTVKDCITILLNTSSGQKNIVFPTFVICNACGVYNGIVISNGKVIYRQDLLRDLLFTKYGFNLRNYDDKPPQTTCSCQADLLKIKQEILGLPLLFEQGWVGSRGGRSITDYTKQVKFSRSLSEDELNLFIRYLKLNSCPGWTGISWKKLNEGLYLFSTCQDRSD